MGQADLCLHGEHTMLGSGSNKLLKFLQPAWIFADTLLLRTGWFFQHVQRSGEKRLGRAKKNS